MPEDKHKRPKIDENKPDKSPENYSDKLLLLESEIKKVIIGHESAIRELIIAFAAGGHVLLEGVPGIAKTLLVKTLSDCTGCNYSRIQFTPDLLPADITGTKIYRFEKSSFETVKGPVFSNIILADEINRAPPKVQSALLEAMQEKQVTIQGDRHGITPPFFVLATQNPIESEGTYPLPEAQTDRFMLKLLMNYPSKEEEIRIIRNFTGGFSPAAEKIIDNSDILEIQSQIRAVYCGPLVENYAAEIVDSTRHPEKYGIELRDYIEFGASPRASISLILSAKAKAVMENRDYVIPDDLREMAHPVLRHRILLNYRAEADGIETEEIIDEILSKVKIP
ncbi:AAA family ATPase [Methanoplanus limicola]|uniref:ATPase associated with various cellular activities AAA_3 n=1 Tax=Methanoplanus limicola DSM 2279 TaxID=937775 RepID=H1YY13_9EURY|nr:MoxR family ATPase [Methanoplanus limicola]EHQ36948.1 ATPase associated with various cellular activities AAA_3 [Methanoplanus limicola DSM 2279]